MKNYFLSFLSLKIIQFVCQQVLQRFCSKLCRNKDEWITKVIQVACSFLLLLLMHFILTFRLQLLAGVSFRMPPTYLVLFFIVIFVMFSCTMKLVFFLLKLQTCHSLQLEKKESSLNQVQIQMKIQLELINSHGIQVSELIINLFRALLATKKQ